MDRLLAPIESPPRSVNHHSSSVIVLRNPYLYSYYADRQCNRVRIQASLVVMPFESWTEPVMGLSVVLILMVIALIIAGYVWLF
jgi:hypothetical protein